MEKILIIEDDTTILITLKNALEFHDFQVFTAETGIRGLKKLQQNKPDLILLDLMLPGPDGFEICRTIKKADPAVPVMMVTAKSSESDKLLGFELGIDDYVTKPFSARELIARIKAVLRRSRSSHPAESSVFIGDAHIRLDNFTLVRKDREFSLSPKEKAILELLINHANQVISREKIIDEIWGDEYFPTPKTIDNFIRKLRLKIEKNPSDPAFILTVHGIGYKLKLSG